MLIGRPLEAAEEWLSAKHSSSQQPSSLHVEFITASRDAERAQQDQEHRRLEEQNRELQKHALDVAGMIAATCEQGASLIFALRKEFGGGRGEALRGLVEQTRNIMEAALDAADKAKTVKISNPFRRYERIPEGSALSRLMRDAALDAPDEAVAATISNPFQIMVSSEHQERASLPQEDDRGPGVQTADSPATSPATNAFANPFATPRLTEQQLQSWKMFQDTSTKIFELMLNAPARRDPTLDKIAEKWKVFIQDTKVDLIERLVILGEGRPSKSALPPWTRARQHRELMSTSTRLLHLLTADLGPLQRKYMSAGMSAIRVRADSLCST